MESTGNRGLSPVVPMMMPIHPGWNDRPIALDLAADGGGVAIKPPGNLPQGEFEQLQVIDCVTFLGSLDLNLQRGSVFQQH